jgi:FixH
MTDSAPDSSRKGAIWAWVPALLLGSMLLGLGVLAFIAIDDPHFALEPNYYEKAVRWDRGQSEARDSAALGLRLTLPPALTQADDGSVEVELRVADREHAGLTAATVELEAFPNAYASRIERLTLKEGEPGVYRGRLTGRTLGLWELRFTIIKENRHFQRALRLDVVKGDAA